MQAGRGGADAPRGPPVCFPCWAGFLCGVAAAAAASLLYSRGAATEVRRALSAECGPAASGQAAAAAAAVAAAPSAALGALLGPYARLVDAAWGPRATVPAPSAWPALQRRKRMVLNRLSQEAGSYLATLGDFNAEWALGVTAPRNATVVEVGTCDGWGAVTIASAIAAAGSGARLLSVDLYDTGKSARKGWCATKERWEARMLEWGLQDIARPLCCSSEEVAAATPLGSVDAVFIDAEHTFRAVYADVSLWWPRLRPDGLMLGHDAFSHHNNVIVQQGKEDVRQLFHYVGWTDAHYYNYRDRSPAGLQGAQVSTAALRFAAEHAAEIEFVCCLPNSSVWHYRRLR
eukprot:TRINITY_DN42856_c0_g1_i1.p1 TRINITY_DN42856_c0_g1~~TRINITY_DN42856_c0_g1_i1.p1  ORF type:complete len:346 (+),score=80.22 TRINITY_DN42856_c0_g1_i1:74-1111(+)